MLKKWTMRIGFFFCLLWTNSAQASHWDKISDEFRGGFWDGHLKPALQKGTDDEGLKLLLGGFALSGASAFYDNDVRDHYQEKRISDDLRRLGNDWGAGFLVGSVAILQTAIDPKNGVPHMKALLFSGLSQQTLILVTQRERPNKENKQSLPSGHTSVAVASATSLAYAYGWAGAIPGYTLALATGLARMQQNKHWLSDVVAGFTWGFVWGRATAASRKEDDDSNLSFYPAPVAGGGTLQLSYSW